MSKFSRKPKPESAASADTASKTPKLWTNNPDWQNQTTGVNTEEGNEQMAKTAANRKEKDAEASPTKAKTVKKAANTDEKEKSPKADKVVKSDDRKIKIVSKENPYREGTKAFATFELLKKSKTVEEFKAGVTDDHAAGYLNFAARDGYISVG